MAFHSNHVAEEIDSGFSNFVMPNTTGIEMGSPGGGGDTIWTMKLLQKQSSPQKFVTPRGSPATTPTKYRPDGGDRYIPIRQSEEEWADKYASITASPLLPSNGNGTPHRGFSARRLFHENTSNNNNNVANNQGAGQPTQQSSMQQSHRASSPAGDSSVVTARSTSSSGGGGAAHQQQRHSEQEGANSGGGHDWLTHRALLRNELLKNSIIDIRSDCDGTEGVRVVERRQGVSLFKYTHRPPHLFGDAESSRGSPAGLAGLGSTDVLFSSSPLSADSQRLLRSPRKPQRKVPKNPYKVLDAPELQDDFYLNLVDWSSQNLLSVGLNRCVYLWSATNSQVIKLCDLSPDNDSVASVQWAERGDFLAVGTQRGHLQIWDTHAQKRIYNARVHDSRVGCLAWNNDSICSGSRDRAILYRDLRESTTSHSVRRLVAHRQEVCGLKWSPNKENLASGGNDNQLMVWSLRRNEPVQTYSEHNAAVKALAWSPHHHGVLVSGGGTADRSLRFWNTMTGQAMQCVETGSQVCNVAWSKHSSELVSTHGYSQNQVILWKYPSMQPIANLTGHLYRVLYLAMSPDGESIVTGAGDETLRFWHVFSKSSTHHRKAARSLLNLHSCIR